MLRWTGRATSTWQTRTTTRFARSRRRESSVRWLERPASPAAPTAAAPRHDSTRRLAWPWTAGNIYVADEDNDAIREVTPAGVVSTLAATDGTGAAAGFQQPRGVAVDDAGNVYVADTGNDVIRIITPTGLVTTLAGGGGGSSSGGDGIGAAAQFNTPFGVAVAGTGNVDVVDSLDSTIRKISNPTVIAQSGLTGTNAVAINAPLTGLETGTTYYFRAVATNPIGTNFGAILSFTTTTTTRATTTTILSASSNPSSLGQAVTFTATVSVLPQGAGVPAGTVTFLDGTTVLGTGTLDGSDMAAYSTSTLTAGDHSITAVYDGEDSLPGSLSNVVDLAVNAPVLAPTTTALSGSPSIADFGELVTFTVIVSAQDSSAGPSTLDDDSVRFTIDGGTGTVVPLHRVAGQDIATLTTSTLADGTHAISASFAGDQSFSSSVSNRVTVIINAPSPTLTTTTLSTPSYSVQGQPVVLTAVVASTGPTPAKGNVSFTVDGVVQTPSVLSYVNGQDVATLTLSMLANGAHVVTASYGGSETFAASTSGEPISVQVIGPAISPDGPLVANFQRFGYHSQPTVLVLTFNEDLDPTTAGSAGNYKIVPVEAHGKFGHSIAITRVVYNPSARTVTLRPSERLNVHRRYELIADGTSAHGIADLALEALDGGKTGKAGSDYVGMIDRFAIAGPSLPGERYAKAWRKLVASGVVTL